jgi:hypothetical protein
MTTYENVIQVIKHCIPMSQTDLTQDEFEELKNNIIMTKYIIDKQFENKHITKTKSLQYLNSNFENEKYIKRSLSEPKKFKSMHVKVYNA